jgi:hypothetical protein
MGMRVEHAGIDALRALRHSDMQAGSQLIGTIRLSIGKKSKSSRNVFACLLCISPPLSI